MKFSVPGIKKVHINQSKVYVKLTQINRRLGYCKSFASPAAAILFPVWVPRLALLASHAVPGRR